MTTIVVTLFLMMTCLKDKEDITAVTIVTAENDQKDSSHRRSAEAQDTYPPAHYGIIRP